jgi:hypothetical protein
MSVCIECAIRRHRYREILSPALRKGVCAETSSREAWIDGRKHRLVHAGPYHISCTDCRQVNASLYEPADG